MSKCWFQNFLSYCLDQYGKEMIVKLEFTHRIRNKRKDMSIG